MRPEIWGPKMCENRKWTAQKLIILKLLAENRTKVTCGCNLAQGLQFLHAKVGKRPFMEFSKIAILANNKEGRLLASQGDDPLAPLNPPMKRARSVIVLPAGECIL